MYFAKREPFGPADLATCARNSKVRNITILATILPQVMFPLLAFGASGGSSGRPSYQLPPVLPNTVVYFCQ
jgi:hypothetical protein